MDAQMKWARKAWKSVRSVVAKFMVFISCDQVPAANALSLWLREVHGPLRAIALIARKSSTDKRTQAFVFITFAHMYLRRGPTTDLVCEHGEGMYNFILAMARQTGNRKFLCNCLCSTTYLYAAAEEFGFDKYLAYCSPAGHITIALRGAAGRGTFPIAVFETTAEYTFPFQWTSVEKAPEFRTALEKAMLFCTIREVRDFPVDCSIFGYVLSDFDASVGDDLEDEELKEWCTIFCNSLMADKFEMLLSLVKSTYHREWSQRHDLAALFDNLLDTDLFERLSDITSERGYWAWVRLLIKHLGSSDRWVVFDITQLIPSLAPNRHSFEFLKRFESVREPLEVETARWRSARTRGCELVGA